MAKDTRADQKALMMTTGNPGDCCTHGIGWKDDCPACDEVWEQMTATKKEKEQAQRIAELERELTEQAKCNGMGSEREAALMAKVERLERDNAQAKEAIATLNAGRPLGDIVGLHTAQNALAEMCRLKEQLAAAQATHQTMREMAARYLRENDTEGFGCACVPDVDYTCGPCRTHQRQQTIRNMLALPADRTALDAMLAEARKEGMLKAAKLLTDADCHPDSIAYKLLRRHADAIRQAAERSE